MDIKPPKNEKLRQWLWFIALWLGGLCTALGIGYAIKFLMRLI